MIGKLLKNRKRNITRTFLIIFLFFSNGPNEINSVQQTKIIFDFVNKGKFGRWMVVNDGVMGGISRSNFSFNAEG